MRKEKKYSSSQQNKDKFIDRLLICLGLFLLAFIITMIIIFCVKDSVPDVLIERVLDASIWEAGITGAITIAKFIRRKDKDGEIDE